MTCKHVSAYGKTPNIYKKSCPHIFFNTQKFDTLWQKRRHFPPFPQVLANLVPEQEGHRSLNESYKALCHVIHLHCPFWEPQKQGRHPIWEPKPPSNRSLNEGLECSAISFIFSVPLATRETAVEGTPHPETRDTQHWTLSQSLKESHPICVLVPICHTVPGTGIS